VSAQCRYMGALVAPSAKHARVFASRIGGTHLAPAGSSSYLAKVSFIGDAAIPRYRSTYEYRMFKCAAPPLATPVVTQESSPPIRTLLPAAAPATAQAAEPAAGSRSVARACDTLRGSPELPIECQVVETENAPFVLVRFPNVEAAEQYRGSLTILLGVPFCASARAPDAGILMSAGHLARAYLCSTGRWDLSWQDPNQPFGPSAPDGWPGWSPALSVAPRALKAPRRPDPVRLYKALQPSVYVIKTDKAQGSAVAIAPDLLLTNCHTLENGSIVVVAGKTPSLATVARADPESDRCVLRIATRTLTPVAGVRPFASLQVGERVFAVGTPRDLDATMSEGIVSGVRTASGIRYVQTTAAISPGSSGGGLFDAAGNLVGITTFFLKDAQALNFAIAAEEFFSD
jgi:S1-C subfamily serine protease